MAIVEVTQLKREVVAALRLEPGYDHCGGDTVETRRRRSTSSWTRLWPYGGDTVEAIFIIHFIVWQWPVSFIQKHATRTWPTSLTTPSLHRHIVFEYDKLSWSKLSLCISKARGTCLAPTVPTLILYDPLRFEVNVARREGGARGHISHTCYRLSCWF